MARATRTKVSMTGLDIERAFELAEVSESELPSVLEAALTRLRVCGSCGHGRDRHTDDGPCERCLGGSVPLADRCMVFSWSVTQGEVNQTVMMLATLARHSERIDRDLGLDVKKIVSGAPIEWLSGVDTAKFKEMTAAEREAEILKRIGGGPGRIEEAVVVPVKEVLP